MYPKTHQGKFTRVAGAFGLVAAAGELASKWNITGWKQGEATQAASVCFASWVEGRGGVGSRDIDNGLERIRAFIERFGSKRFQLIRTSQDENFEIPDEVIDQRAGAKQLHEDGWHYFVLTDAFQNEICKGYDYKAIANVLIERGQMKRTGPNLTDKKRIPGLGPRRVFHILPQFLDFDQLANDEN
jgi:uncharacterized protein (DUF927 family)